MNWLSSMDSKSKVEKPIRDERNLMPLMMWKGELEMSSLLPSSGDVP